MGARLGRIWNAIREPVLAILLVVFARTALADPFYVPSGSMEPTPLIGDELLAAKYAYGYSRYSLSLGLGGKLDRLLGSDDYKAAEIKSIWSWPSTLRLSRFLASVG